MKITVISPSSQSLQDIRTTLESGNPSRSITTAEGGKSRVAAVADQERPDLIILECMCRDLEDLAALEYVTTHHPQMMVIMLCAHQTPEFLINAMRAGVREVLPSPASSEALNAAVMRVERKLGGAASIRQPGKVLAFVPCKGGSGATFIATNLGYQLAMEGAKVLLIDLNLQFGDAVLFVHDHKPPTNLADVARNIHRLDASFLAASTVQIVPGYGVLAAPEDPAQCMEIKPEHLDALLNLAIGQYDFVILDVGRTLDAVSIKALDRAERIFPVLQTTLPFIRDASRLLTVFRSLGYAADKIELIVNRFEKGSEITLNDIQASVGTIKMKTFPNSYAAVAASVNQGRPIASMTKNNSMTKSLHEFAQLLFPKPEETASWLGRLLRRA